MSNFFIDSDSEYSHLNNTAVFEGNKDQIGMFGKFDMLPFSAHAYTWDADFSTKTIKCTSMLNNKMQCFSFYEFLSSIDQKEADTIESLFLPRNEEARQNIDLQVKIKTDIDHVYKIKGILFALPDKVFAAGIAYSLNLSKEYLNRLEYFEYHDHLTGLKNIHTFETYFRDIVKFSALSQTLVIANIDSLKDINDTLGYYAGNTLIKNVADVLKEVFCDAEIIARIGGGEYCAVFLSKSELEIEMMVKEADMLLHRLYLNLIKTEVTFGYVTNDNNSDFSQLYGLAVKKIQKSKNVKTILKESSVIDRLNDIVSRKTGWGKRHVRLQSLCAQIGRELGCSQDVIKDIKVLAKTADIGLVGIDDKLIRDDNAGIGATKEFDMHIEYGRAMIASIPELADMENAYLDIYKRYDEWKEGLALSSRIVAGAIGFDNITLANEVVRFDHIKEKMLKDKGTKYCPLVVDAIIRVMRKHYA